VVLAGGAGAYFLTRKPGEKPAVSKGGTTTPPAEVAGGPPEKGLVAWLDASKGGRTNAGKTLAKTGDRVDQWDDRAALGGNNTAQYHASGSPPAEKALRRPTLTRLTDTDGLKGTHEVMQFNGQNCLVFGRDSDKVGDPLGKLLSSNQISWIGVFSADPAGGEQALLGAHVGSEPQAWDTFVRSGKVYSGVRKTGGLENHASLRLEPNSGFHIVAVVWDGSHDRLREWVTAPGGKTTQSTAVSETKDFGHLADIRIGAFNPQGSRPMGAFLKGSIASLLLYNRALEDSEREAAVDYLSRRYFGVPAAKP
jgi:hypothetical protein